MLREFQEEIMRLKAIAKRRWRRSGFGGGGKVQERIVEKVVYKEGISEAKMRELEERNAKERAEIEKKARSEVERLKLTQSRRKREESHGRSIERERAEAGKAEKVDSCRKKN